MATFPFVPSATSSTPLKPSTIIAPSSSSSNIFTKLTSISLALSILTSPPSLAIPTISSSPNQTTLFSLSHNIQLGLEDGKIRPCPSINPSCVSSNPKSSLFSFPWEIPSGDSEQAIRKIRDAILETQRNAKIIVVEDTSSGQYLQAEVDGTFGRDVLEFLVKENTVSYRSMAERVTFIYPFTTAIGDSKGQKERLKKIRDHLGWFEPSFEYMN